MINVTKTFLPPIDDYVSTLKRAWDKAWITNNGELALELEEKLKSYLGVRNLLFCGNGTIVLQMALKAFDITGEVITTPFSYVATTTAILWENCKPVFVDINKSNFCIDPSKIEAAITTKTQAILATHVYGYPCDVTEIERIARKHQLKVIYDGAHAFGTKINGRSLLDYGDISTCSFHATKLFHTVEGGCILTPDDELLKKLFLYKHFGHIGDEYFSIGINGKNSEFHAAMGICNLNYIGDILAKRKKSWTNYANALRNASYEILNIPETIEYNYAYFPFVFESEKELLSKMNVFQRKGIKPRRYFYPSLNRLPYFLGEPCPNSESIAQRVVCLPLFHDITELEQDTIVSVLLEG
jgi:dTDP-4-amino-4,6-dideoxygalactose transaminase